MLNNKLAGKMPRNEKITHIRNRIITLKPTPRVERHKEVFLNTEPRIEIDRERIYTRVMKETDGEPMAIRRARAFCAVVREMPINITRDELFVGYINATWAGYRVSAKSGPPTIEEVLEYAKKRRSVISEEDEREIRNDIIPYWKSIMPGTHYYELVPDKEHEGRPRSAWDAGFRMAYTIWLGCRGTSFRKVN